MRWASRRLRPSQGHWRGRSGNRAGLRVGDGMRELCGRGVDPSAWRLAIVSGAGQTVPATATFALVVAMVTDGSGDPVAGAPVAIYQTVEAAEMPCPVRGRAR